MGEEIEFPENQNQFQEDVVEDDEQVLNFMDSLDSYLSLINSLSSSLRQGWFDLASARYSMGTSRVNGVLLDLKEHSAATYVEVGTREEPHFTLCKWTSVNTKDSREPTDGDSALTQTSIRQRHKDKSEPDEGEDDSRPIVRPLVNNADQSRGSDISVKFVALFGPSFRLDPASHKVQKERVKSLAVFGTLISPKLRSSQSSFETALETLIEIANVRASMLSSFDKLRKNVVNVDGVKN